VFDFFLEQQICDFKAVSYLVSKFAIQLFRVAFTLLRTKDIPSKFKADFENGEVEGQFGGNFGSVPCEPNS
jgi:hypothetical protein